MTYPVRRHTTNGVLAFAALLATSCLTPVMVQAQSDEAPPRYSLDVNNKDLGTGKLSLFSPEGGIGTLSRTVSRSGPAKNNWDIWFCQQDQAGDPINVTLGLTSQSFTEPGINGNNYNWDQIVFGTTTHTLYKENGDIFVFDAAISRPNCMISGTGVSIKHPNGEYKRLHYKSVVVSGSTKRRLQSITSSFGYQIKFNYNSNDTSSASWTSLANVVSLNNAVDYCDPMADTCTFSVTWPTVSSSTPSGNGTVTDALGRQTIYAGTSVTTPQGVVTTYSGSQTGISTVTRGGGTWTYNRTGRAVNTGDYPPPVKWTTTVTDPFGNVTVATTIPANSLKWNYMVGTIKDPLNKVTTLTYDDGGNLSSATYPEGNMDEWFYLAGEVDGRAKTSKPADGSVRILSGSGGYSDACTGSAICLRPAYSRDFNGKQTDYTYDSVHGGVLTVTAPADSNGIRPKTTNTYTLMYPQVKNAAGALVNGDPIYMLTKSSTCRTTASCATTADETVTTYTYNNNLLKASETVASGDGSLSVTTSYGYDNYGRVVWVDGPRTDVDDKSYVTYDLAGQKIFEIGPDPDGGGALLRQIVKHVYNLDGQETETRMGTGSATDGSNFVTSSFKRMTYNSYGQLVKTEAVVP